MKDLEEALRDPPARPHIPPFGIGNSDAIQFNQGIGVDETTVQEIQHEGIDCDKGWMFHIINSNPPEPNECYQVWTKPEAGAVLVPWIYKEYDTNDRGSGVWPSNMIFGIWQQDGQRQAKPLRDLQLLGQVCIANPVTKRIITDISVRYRSRLANVR